MNITYMTKPPRRTKRIALKRRLQVLLCALILIPILSGVIKISGKNTSYGSRIAVLLHNNSLLIKNDFFSDKLQSLHMKAKSFQFDEDNLYVLSDDSRIVHVDSKFDKKYLFKNNNVKSFFVENNLIGILLLDGSFFIGNKEDDLNDLEPIYNNVKNFKIKNNHIVLHLNNNNIVYRTYNNPNWKILHDNISSFDLTPNRIVALSSSGELLFKENNFLSKWSKIASNVMNFKISEKRIGILLKNNEFKAMEGDSKSPFITLFKDVTKFDLNVERIGILKKNGYLYVNHGALDSKFELQKKNTKSFSFKNFIISAIDNKNSLYIKEGYTNNKWQFMCSGVKNYTICNDEIMYEEKNSIYTKSFSKVIDSQFKKSGTKDMIQKGSKWVKANRKDLDFYMDPQNYSNSKNKYQHLDLSYNANVSIDELSKYLKGRGILSNLSTSFIDSCKNYNLNEIYLVAHAIHETGNGTSTLSKGVKYKGTTVYNMFGIGAFDASPLKSGAKYAYINGWTTPSKAIFGGAKWISENYINNSQYRQNTLYKMKWNPKKPSIHQYATDVGWALKQAEYMNKMYSIFQCSKKRFDYPIYK